MADRGGELAAKIWVTKGARFNAYRRLTGKHQSSLTATAFMSVYVVFLQLGPTLVPSWQVHLSSGALTLVTSFLAIAILVLSLVEQGRAYQLRAERLHRCGLALNELYDRLENGRSKRTDELPLFLDQISDDYRKILMCVPENHEPIDNDLFRAQHREHFSVSWFRAFYIRAKCAVITYGLAGILIVGFPIVIVLTGITLM